MDASAWIAFGGLLFIVVAQLVTLAFVLGGLFNRVKVSETKVATLESKPSTDCKSELDLLTYKFEEMKKTLEGLASDFRASITPAKAVSRRVSNP
jgi:hypothetical protein